jgi:hypothetical protein
MTLCESNLVSPARVYATAPQPEKIMTQVADWISTSPV